MRKLNCIFVLLLTSIVLINPLSAQNLEVFTGPILDSTNYVAPKPIRSALRSATATVEIPIAHFQQCSSTWGSDAYGIGSCSSICVKGCALSCGAMLLKTNGVNTNPGLLNTWLKANSGYSVCDVYWAYGAGGVANYPGSTMTWYGRAAYNLATIKSEIDGGNPVIVHVKTCSHFVTVYAYNNSGTTASDFLVSDPGTASFPTKLSDYAICTETEALRIFHNVYSSLNNMTPPNDDCTNAITLSDDTTIYTYGTVDYATESNLTDSPQCGGYTSDTHKDVFYKFTPTKTDLSILVQPDNVSSVGLDQVVAVYAGTSCNDMQLLTCADPSGMQSTVLNLSSLQIGKTYWIRIYDYGSVQPDLGLGGFNIALTHTNTALTEIQKSKQIQVVPNPLKDFASIVGLPFDGELDMRLVNLFGDLISVSKLNASNGKAEINLSSLLPGVYFVGVSNGGKYYWTQIIKKGALF